MSDPTRPPRWLDLNADETAEDVVLPVEVRVKQGMALLDEKHGPEWVDRIDVDTLNLRDSCRCVLGQLNGGDYDRGLSAVGINPHTKYDTAEDIANGFDLPCSDPFGVDYSPLTTAWKHAILARRLERS